MCCLGGANGEMRIPLPREVPCSSLLSTFRLRGLGMPALPKCQDHVPGTWQHCCVSFLRLRMQAPARQAS